MSDTREYTGGKVNYYRVRVDSPLSGDDAYTAECNDIIEALGMNYAEGNAFKAIWRSCAAKNLGLAKKGYDDALYDAEKAEFFGARMVAQAKRTSGTEKKEASAVVKPASPEKLKVGQVWKDRRGVEIEILDVRQPDKWGRSFVGDDGCMYSSGGRFHGNDGESCGYDLVTLIRDAEEPQP